MKSLFCIVLSLLLATGCAGTTGPSSGSGSINTPPAVSTPGDSSTQEEENTMDSITITVTIGGKPFSATLENNETTRALVDRLPLTLNMSELNGNEKYYFLNESLPTDAECPGQIHTGDLMLYGDNCLVLFYESFSTGYSYTRLGAVDDPAGLAEAVGHGGVTVTFSI